MPVDQRVRSVLVVDDNRMYREAVRRNLEFVGYDVTEAEDKLDALEKIRQRIPHVVITDLDMRTRTEGLELIKDVKARYPTLPVVLISAVGTFDEGALARQYGAMHVISKSRIDEEVENLYSRLDQVFVKLNQLENLSERVNNFLEQDEKERDEDLENDLNQMLIDTEADTGFKSEVYDHLLRVREKAMPKTIVGEAAVSRGSVPEEIENQLREAVPCFGNLDEESRTMLLTAERLLSEEHDQAESLSVLRNVSFSYCFAVENEVKARLGKKVARFVGSKPAAKLIDTMYDKKRHHLDLFFNRYVILTFQNRGLELNVDITRQVLERMQIHGDKYKPDGLKALGVIVFCFGREYEFESVKGKMKVNNPLGLKGLEEEETIVFANLLIRLQHLRNPYIHPEFSEREKIDKIRQVAVDSMNFCGRLHP
jgi:CheY-like chemotaxis protein